MTREIRWYWKTITTDKFIALILALIIIFFMFNEVAKLLQKAVKNRKTSDALVRGLLVVFMLVVCIFLLNYVFRWF